MLITKLILCSTKQNKICFKIIDDNYTHFTVNWANHFVNDLEEKGKFLNKILPYPIQFEDLQDDGILMSKKYVYSWMR